MKYLIDTDIIIYWLKGHQAIEQKAKDVGLEQMGFSIVSQAELYFGAYHSTYPERNLEKIQLLSNTIKVIPFTGNAARIFGLLKANLKKTGNIIMDADLMIASTALANELILVSNNVRHFQRISGLTLENWL
jgi:tRNA(fMet)-specific endonuclease VapC